MSNRSLPAHLAKSQEEYQRLGVKPRQIALWEDGLRTDSRKGTYEW